MKASSIKSVIDGLVLTYDQEEALPAPGINGGSIKVIPAWKWMLDQPAPGQV